MIDTKKEQERDELHRAIWAIADELRGAVDGWDFKNYVLGTMFYRYISENLCSYINNGEAEAGNMDFDFAAMSDDEAEEARAGLVEEKGFKQLCVKRHWKIHISHILESEAVSCILTGEHNIPANSIVMRLKNMASSKA